MQIRRTVSFTVTMDSEVTPVVHPPRPEPITFGRRTGNNAVGRCTESGNRTNTLGVEYGHRSETNRQITHMYSSERSG